MARRKRTSTVLETARARLLALKTLTPPPSFGGDLDLSHYEQYILNFESKLETYNSTIAVLDGLQNEVGAAEDVLRDFNKRMLAATGAKYGTDSNEYEIAGGTRDSERKAPTRAPAGTT